MFLTLRRVLVVAIVASFPGWLTFPDTHAQEKQAVEAQDDPPVRKAPELSDMELIERVAFLQRELESPEIKKRDAAEAELIGHGVRVLDYLDPPNEKTTTQAIERLGRIRQILEKIAVAAVTEASIVTLKGKMTVGKALAKIRNQSGNDVNLPDGAPDVFRDREIELDLKDVAFWLSLIHI